VDQTQAALLQALHDDPADVVSWAALADWLEDNGQPRQAELTRLRLFLSLERDMEQRVEVEERAVELLLGGVRPCVPTMVNSVGMEFALIPAGVFWMGSERLEFGHTSDERPRHLVQITQPFYIGVYPVTQDQYARVIGGAPSAFSDTGERRSDVEGIDTSDFPVETVMWGQGALFCQSLSTLTAEEKAGRLYRLPTEAEWEYCCRAGTQAAPYATGHTLLPRWANCAMPRAPSLRRPSPVGSYPPNLLGLYDMHGNVWEWCADVYRSNYYANSPPKDPPGPPWDFFAHDRVIRGGSWQTAPVDCRTAKRLAIRADSPANTVGFRVVCVPAPKRSSR
jgi:uncharacterized protein (TIGR02996 family)